MVCERCRQPVLPGALFCSMCGSPQTKPGGDPLIGEVVADRYLLLQRLGQGGSGTIYLAEHVTLRRRVAVKVLHHELSRDELAVERFRREATTVGEIDNDHIVEVFDFGRLKDGRLFLSMELLDGETLHQAIQRQGKLALPQVVDTLMQIGEALMEAHALGYVHRDLRPANVFLHRRRGKPFVKLLDFGLAKLVEREGEAASTGLAMTFGDPRYMSPEQARGAPVDRRADIYSLGIIAYEMLAGQPPFTGQRVFDVLTQHIETPPPPPSSLRPEVPTWLDAVVLRMLAKSVDQRFVTVYRMVEALRDGAGSGRVMPAEAATSMHEDVELPRRRTPALFGALEEVTNAPAPEPVPAAIPAPAAAAVPAPVAEAPSKPNGANGAPPTASQPVSMAKADPRGMSGSWYDEGEELAEAGASARPPRKFEMGSMSDIQYEPPDRRWMIKLAGAILAVAVVGTGALVWWARNRTPADEAATPDAATAVATVSVPDASGPSGPDAAVPSEPDASEPVPDAAVAMARPRTPREPDEPRRPVDPKPDTPPPPSDENAAQASFYVKLGRKALADGNTTSAVENFNKARGADSRNADAIAGLGEVALSQNRYDEAVVHLEAASRLAPRSARTHLLRGKALLGAGRKVDAALAFKRVLMLDPDNATAAAGYREATGKDLPR